LSRLVARLVRRGLVSRARSKTSNREVVVELTARGRTLVNSLIPMAKTLEQTAIVGIPAKELAALKASLRRAFANVTKAR
jgi:DNA-binding MarR family transcriptional regulator